MAALTIEVPDHVAEALDGLPAIRSDWISLKDSLARTVGGFADELADWSESRLHEDDHATELRDIITRLDAFVSALEKGGRADKPA